MVLRVRTIQKDIPIEVLPSSAPLARSHFPLSPPFLPHHSRYPISLVSGLSFVYFFYTNEQIQAGSLISPLSYMKHSKSLDTSLHCKMVVLKSVSEKKLSG